MTAQESDIDKTKMGLTTKSKFLEDRVSMTAESSSDKRNDEITYLRILAEGCRKHPAYRARRRPGVDGCEACDAMYVARQELNALELAETIPRP